MVILDKKKNKIIKSIPGMKWSSEEESMLIYFYNKFPKISNCNLFKKMKAEGYIRSPISISAKRQEIECEIEMQELKKKELNDQALKIKSFIIGFDIINYSILDESNLIWELFNC